ARARRVGGTHRAGAAGRPRPVAGRRAAGAALAGPAAVAPAPAVAVPAALFLAQAPGHAQPLQTAAHADRRRCTGALPDRLGGALLGDHHVDHVLVELHGIADALEVAEPRVFVCRLDVERRITEDAAHQRLLDGEVGDADPGDRVRPAADHPG